MKQGHINIAHGTLSRLYRIEGLPFGLSSCLFNAKRRLDPYIEHQQEQEIAALEANGEMNPDGSYTLTDEQKKAFNDLLLEIREADVEYDYKPVKISITAELCEKMGITGETNEALDGIVIIEVDGKTSEDFAGDWCGE